jgi:hypothetical protein
MFARGSPRISMMQGASIQKKKGLSPKVPGTQKKKTTSPKGITFLLLNSTCFVKIYFFMVLNI